MVAARDFRELPSLLHPNVVLRSPLGFKSFQGAPAVAQILATVSGVLTNFRYEREFVSRDLDSVALEFSASIGDKQLKGIDLVRFNEAGQITEFEVMVRPLSGLQALGAEMGARLGDKLPAFKAKA